MAFDDSLFEAAYACKMVGKGPFWPHSTTPDRQRRQLRRQTSIQPLGQKRTMQKKIMPEHIDRESGELSLPRTTKCDNNAAAVQASIQWRPLALDTTSYGHRHLRSTTTTWLPLPSCDQASSVGIVRELTGHEITFLSYQPPYRPSRTFESQSTPPIDWHELSRPR